MTGCGMRSAPRSPSSTGSSSVAEVSIAVGARTYVIACRDGEEPRLHEVAQLVDQKAKAAAQALGNLSESRQLLFASLMLADALVDSPAPRQQSVENAPAQGANRFPELEALAKRIEALADALERGVPSA